MTRATDEYEFPLSGHELVAAAVTPGVVLLLVVLFGLRAWWWVLPLSMVLAMFGQLVAAFLAAEPWPEPPPAKRKASPDKPRRVSPRRQSKVINLAAERERRERDNG